VNCCSPPVRPVRLSSWRIRRAPVVHVTAADLGELACSVEGAKRRPRAAVASLRTSVAEALESLTESPGDEGVWSVLWTPVHPARMVGGRASHIVAVPPASVTCSASQSSCSRVRASAGSATSPSPTCATPRRLSLRQIAIRGVDGSRGTRYASSTHSPGRPARRVGSPGLGPVLDEAEISRRPRTDEHGRAGHDHRLPSAVRGNALGRPAGYTPKRRCRRPIIRALLDASRCHCNRGYIRLCCGMTRPCTG
jgi:hypothetical protein